MFKERFEGFILLEVVSLNAAVMEPGWCFPHRSLRAKQRVSVFNSVDIRQHGRLQLINCNVKLKLLRQSSYRFKLQVVKEPGRENVEGVKTFATLCVVLYSLHRWNEGVEDFVPEVGPLLTPVRPHIIHRRLIGFSPETRITRVGQATNQTWQLITSRNH